MHREKHWVKTQIPSARSILQTACCFTDMSSELLLEIDFFLVVLMNASADNWAVMDVNANWFKSFSHALVECFSKLRPTCREDLSLSCYSIAKVLFSLCYRCMANKCLQCFVFFFLPDSGMREKVKHLNEFSLWAIK